MKMKAAVIRQMGLPQPYADSKPMSIEEVELDKPGQREVLVQIKAASLCHSDLSTVNGDRPRQMPMVLGHEASGVVQEVGGGINDLKVGDHVALVFAPSCGQCLPCVEGHPGRCEPGQQANGAGKLLNGAQQIVAIDLHEDKLKLAKELGATDTVNAKDPDAIQKVKDLTGGGVHFAFEMAGSVQAMELAYRITRRGGTTVTAGLPHPDHRWPLQHVNLVAEERTIKGSYVGSCVPSRDIPRYIDLYRRGMLPVNKLMSDHIKLEDINVGFDRLASGHTVRQIIMM